MSLLRQFQSLHPTLPPNVDVYIAGLPSHDFFKYGCWTYPRTLVDFLSLFYDSKMNIHFVPGSEIDALYEKSRIDGNALFIVFRNGELHDFRGY
jgi:hypothetical protein